MAHYPTAIYPADASRPMEAGRCNASVFGISRLRQCNRKATMTGRVALNFAITRDVPLCAQHARGSNVEEAS
jgi:hypothetical protein